MSRRLEQTVVADVSEGHLVQNVVALVPESRAAVTVHRGYSSSWYRYLEYYYLEQVPVYILVGTAVVNLAQTGQSFLEMA
eukprot:SAG31_NODE_825_length_11760_cov_5.637767_8_plen_80_part_00